MHSGWDIFSDTVLGTCWIEYRKSVAAPSVEIKQLSEAHMTMSESWTSRWTPIKEDYEMIHIGTGNDHRNIVSTSEVNLSSIFSLGDTEGAI